jgi:SAM-dependent methyltransferase
MTRASDPRMSFDGAAELYNEIRPNYPAAMFDDLFRLLSPRPVIVEVGPGTGQATRDLLSRGAIVHAVEIGPAIAAKLRSGLPSEDLHVTVGDFDRVDIPERSTDAVFSATAYHWISVQAQLDRPAAILKPYAIMGIVDLNQVESTDDDGFFEAAQLIYERYGEGHTGPPAPKRDNVDPPVGQALRAAGDGAVDRNHRRLRRRQLFDFDDAFVARRLEGLRQQLETLDDPKALGVDVPELDVDRGYDAWARSYDASTTPSSGPKSLSSRRLRGARRSTSTPGQDLAVQLREPSHPAGSRLSGSANVQVALLDQRSRKRPSAVAASGQRASTRNQCQVMVRWMRASAGDPQTRRPCNIRAISTGV